MATTQTNKATRFFIYTGRLAGALAILALVGAWASEFTDGALFGLSQQHLFSDAIAFSLVGIGLGLDGWLRAKNL